MEISYENAVQAHYESLYRFAVSLTNSESAASDLTQATFERLLRKSADVRDPAKLKSWLFTTLYRLFIEQKRSEKRHPHVDLDDAPVPHVESTAGEALDASTVMAALQQLEEPFRTPLALFYLDQHSYREIGEILGLPIGTVMSRLSRGKALLRALLTDRAPNIIPFPLRAAS